MPAYGQPLRIDAPAWWLQEVQMVSKEYGVDPNFALAVAETESSYKGQQFRFGRMGRTHYSGPFGINRCFLRKWNVDDPWINTVLGIRALSFYRNKRQTLQHYNANFNEGYYRRVRELERRNKKEGVFNEGNY